jgi:hypothetical protein
VTFRHALTGAAAASALLGAGAGAAAAQAAPSSSGHIPNKLEHQYLGNYKKVKKLGGQPGRNLLDDGVKKHGHERAAKVKDLRRSLKVLVRMEQQLTAPAPQPTASTSTSSTSTTAPATTGSTGGGNLGAIAACESGGNPGAVDSSGTYRGKYQFDQQTWESVGGTGDPAAASSAEQDARAAQLYAQRGASAWPVCGR